MEKIEEFLSAGGSKKPEDIFADIGIDDRDPEFFKIGLEQIKKYYKIRKVSVIFSTIY